jgi:DNA-binding GntR family transcriptional regulator
LTFKPFATRPSLGSQVYETIKKSILSLELQPGTILAIGDLAAQFEISRTPVRDALLLLEKDELVTIIPHKGAKVTEITARDVEEMYELHIALESYAVRTIVPHLTDEDIVQFEQIISDSRQALDQRQYSLASDIGRTFHDAFIQKHGNRRLMSYLQELDILYTRLRHFSALMPGRLEKSYEQHLAILQALKKRDAELATQCMTAHFISISDEILHALRVQGFGVPLSDIVNPAQATRG